MFCSLAALLAATSAVQARLVWLRELAAPQPISALAFEQFNELIGMPDVAALETRFTFGKTDRGSF